MKELALAFARLGFTAFGGPAAHIAMMEDEFVRRRGWLSGDHFLDLVGATNLIPGPNSTEMALHIGYERRGWGGLLVAGSAFILPAALTTGFLGWLYVAYGSLPQLAPFLAGIEPAILAIILGALWRLGKKAVKGWRLAGIGAAVFAAVLLGADEVLALLAGGIAGALWLRLDPGAGGGAAALLLAPWTGGAAGAGGTAAAGGAASVSLWQLGLLFLKIGAILYGSGYVLVAFLEGSLVDGYGWLTEEQLLDVIALGQFTPGPVLATATVVGYIVAGLPGAGVATLGIFLPSFVFVLILNPVIPRLRESAWASAFLDAVNVTAVGLMAAVLVQLGRASLVEWWSWLVLGLAAAAVLRFRVPSPWVVVGAAALGWTLESLA